MAALIPGFFVVHVLSESQFARNIAQCVIAVLLNLTIIVHGLEIASEHQIISTSWYEYLLDLKVGSLLFNIIRVKEN